MNNPLFMKLAQLVVAIRNCDEAGNMVWHAKHRDRVCALVKEHMPSGSGFDAGTQFDIDAQKPERLVFSTAFHHMDENGSYHGWSDHTVVVTPSLSHGFVLRVTGNDRNSIKDYIHEVFHEALSTLVAD